jgi:hypothetical protein
MLLRCHPCFCVSKEMFISVLVITKSTLALFITLPFLFSFSPNLTSLNFYFFFTLIIIPTVQLFKLCNFRYHLPHRSLLIILQNTFIASLTLHSIMTFCIPHTHTHIQISSYIIQSFSTSLPTFSLGVVFSLSVPVE